METKKSVAVLLAFIMLAVGSIPCGTMAQAEPEQTLEHRVYASCLLKITSNSSVLPIDGRTIHYLANSSGVAGKAARNVGINEASDFLKKLGMKGLVSVQELSRTENRLGSVFLFQFHLPHQPEEFMNRVIKNLTKDLNTDYAQSIQYLVEQRVSVAQEARTAEAHLDLFQKELRELAGSRGSLSRQAVVEEIDKLREKIQNAEFQLEYDWARMNYSQQKAAQTRDKMQGQPSTDDPVTVELEKVVQTYTNQLERLLAQDNRERPESAMAREKLIKARIDLAQQREQKSKSGGAKELDRLTREIAKYSRNVAEQEQSLSVRRRQLDQAQGLLEKADRYEILTIKAEQARENFKEAVRLRDRLERERSMIQPPVVSVLGGTDQDEDK
ncbi:MAG: hypothetical protein ACYTFK_06310 [Planctomycetota bacterium]|jgi:hypothetical protein